MSDNEKRTLAELRQHVDDVKQRMRDLAGEYTDRDFSDEANKEFSALKDELGEAERAVKAREDREAILAELDGKPEAREDDKPVFTRATSRKRVPDNIHDLAEYRTNANGIDELNDAYRDGAKKVLENLVPAHPNASTEDFRSHVEKLLDSVDDPEQNRPLARRIIHTSSPEYQRAFSKALTAANTHGLTDREMRSLGLGSQGGNYPVPAIWDPTLNLTSNGQVNPLRQISNVVSIVGNTYYGVNTDGVSASYVAEGTLSTDGSPTLTQPTWNVEKAHVFIPVTDEESEDWGALAAEMARCIQDAKDALESTKFLAGAGHGSQEPQGLLVGGTAVVLTAATAVFAAADVYSLEEALAPRWQPNASIVANKKYLNKVRQFDTGGGAQLWAYIGDGTPGRLLDYPTFQYSSMTTAATSNASIVTIGDFSQFNIVDRIGLNIELVPHLFGTTGYPNGTKGFYAHWRNTSGVKTQKAFKTLKLL